MAWQLQSACSRKAAEGEFSVSLWGVGEDVNLSWLSLHLALGWHAQCSHCHCLDRPVYFASHQTQAKNQWQLTHLFCFVVLFF